VSRLLSLIVIVFTLGSCGDSRIPEGVLSEDKMVEVLIDIHMAEGYVSSFPIHYDSSRRLYPLFETEVFRQHQISDSVFIQSLEYYMRDTRVMNKIYARTIDSLSVIEKTGTPKQ
jgi:hypothetical protein